MRASERERRFFPLRLWSSGAMMETVTWTTRQTRDTPRQAQVT